MSDTVSVEGFPDGLRCMDCDEIIENGQTFSERLVAMRGDVACTELICVPCALAPSQEEK